MGRRIYVNLDALSPRAKAVLAELVQETGRTPGEVLEAIVKTVDPSAVAAYVERHRERLLRECQQGPGPC
jgi:hypothetical protein